MKNVESLQNAFYLHSPSLSSLVLVSIRGLDVVPESAQPRPADQGLQGQEGVQGLGQDRAELHQHEGGHDGEVQQVHGDHRQVPEQQTCERCLTISAVDNPSVSQSVFTITEKAPSTAFMTFALVTQFHI